MNSDELEDATERLRRLLRDQVPDLLLQAECGGGLELPSPLPWGFASVPTLYELADIAERELYDQRRQSELRDQHDRQHQPTPSNSQPAPEVDGHRVVPQQPTEPLGQELGQQPEEAQPYTQGPPPWPPPAPAQQQCDAQADAYNERHGDDGLPRGRTPPPSGQPPPSPLLPLAQPSQAQQPPQHTRRDREHQDLHAGDTGYAQHHAQLGGATASAPPGWDGGSEEDVTARSSERGGRYRDALGGSERQVEGGCAAGVSETGTMPANGGGSQAAGPLAAGESHGGQGTATGTRAAGGGIDGPRDNGYPSASTPPVEAGAGGQSTVGEQRESAMGPAAEAPPAPAPELPPPPVVYVCTAFLESLEQSRTFRSPHCEGAMVEAMGMLQLYEGLAGSTLGPPPEKGDLEVLRSLFKDHINARWALEAVKQGVAAAKQGNYADAHKAYARALELDPRSAEAYVARGAAHANQRAFAEAEHDLRHALSLEPGHRNAAAYLDAVLRHVEEQRQQLEELERERQQALARQHPHQQGRQRSAGRGPAGQGTLTPPGPALGAGRAAGGEALAAGVQGRDGPASEPTAGRRRRGGDDSGSSSSGTASSLSGSSGSDTPGRGGMAATQRPASDDIKRALEVVLKARKSKRKSKHKKHKKKHKKSKRHRRD